MSGWEALAGMDSLTGGGGIANTATAEAKVGDTSGHAGSGNTTINYGPPPSVQKSNNLMIIGAIVLVAVVFLRQK